MTLEGLFEPTVMLFGLTNSSTMFQTILNEILWDFINTREVASFINDMTVEIKEEEGHDKVSKEIVKSASRKYGF